MERESGRGVWFAASRAKSRYPHCTVRRAVEHRRIQAAFEIGARESLEQYQRTGISHPVGEVFDRLEAKLRMRRAQVLGE